MIKVAPLGWSHFSFDSVPIPSMIPNKYLAPDNVFVEDKN